MIIYSALYDENISHFIGQWHLASEGARMRANLDAFRRQQEQEEDPDPLRSARLHPHQSFQIGKYLPGVEHHPEDWHPSGQSPVGLSLLRANIDVPLNNDWDRPLDPHMHWPPVRLHHQPGEPASPEGPFPGQVIYIVNQAHSLQDNDVLNLSGGPEPVLDPHISLRLLQLTDSAEAVDLLDPVGLPHTPEQLGELVTLAHEVLAEVTEGGAVVASGHSLTGSFVDGESVSDVPLLDDVLPLPFLPIDATAPIEADHLTAVIDETGHEGDVALQAGANLALNAAVFSNLGLLGGVIAVAGDVYQLDAIIQSNALSDLDRIGDAAPSIGASQSYNVATFSNLPMTYAPPGESVDEGLTPAHWSVTVVDGDLIFSQWLVQTNFIYDNDVHVLQDTGASSSFVTGANLAHNIVDFSQLGQVYDLILIGGNLYDANIISQINVLLDDDWMSDTVSGRTNGEADSSGNLLFNGASITNVGAQNWLDGLPTHYLEALDRLAAGDRTMPEGFGQDGAFKGFDDLSVLVVTGNVYDVHYIKQMNVVGDVDLVAAAESAARELGGEDADWHISTGQNALINTAAILDADSLGEYAYTGGQVYSDAVLIQSEILVGSDDAGPDALINEAIAFIIPDDDLDAYPMDDAITHSGTDGGGLDPVGSVLT